MSGGRWGRLQQETDLLEAEAGTLGCVDDCQLAQDLARIAAAAADPFRRADEGDRLVVADRRGRLACALYAWGSKTRSGRSLSGLVSVGLPV